MALISEKISESLQRDKNSLIALDNTTKDLTKSIEATDKAIDEYSQKIKENKEEINKGNLSMKRLGEITAQNTELEDNKQELLKQKSEQQEDKGLAGEEETEILEDIRKNIFKISDEEKARRQESADQIKLARDNLKLLEKSNENGIYDQEIAEERKNIDQAEKDEATRREKQQTSVFKKGFTGLQNKFSDFGKSLKGKGITALKTGLFIAAYFALAKFLQSDAFKKMTKFIYEVIIPNLKEIGLIIGVLAAAFISFKIVSIISGIVTSFKVMKAAFLATKLGLALASTPLLPIVGIVAAIALVIGGLFAAFKDFQTTLEETGSLGEALKAGAAKFVGFILGFVPNLILKLVGFIAGLFGFDDFKEKLATIDVVEFISEKVKMLFAKWNFIKD